MFMKIRLYEEYYDKRGNTYQEWDDIPDNRGVTYINPGLVNVIPKLEKIKNELNEIYSFLENVGPGDEDIEDVIDSIDRVFEKWKNRPINKNIKKFNI